MPVTKTPAAMLNRLVFLRDQVANLEAVRQAKVAKLTAPIRAALERVETEFAKRVGAAVNETAAIEAEIKKLVVSTGKSLKGTHVAADGTVPTVVYSKSRTTWDTKKLEGVALVIPEVAQCRTTAPTGGAALRWDRVASE